MLKDDRETANKLVDRILTTLGIADTVNINSKGLFADWIVAALNPRCREVSREEFEDVIYGLEPSGSERYLCGAFNQFYSMGRSRPKLMGWYKDDGKGNRRYWVC